MDNSTIYCRENVLQAFYSLGSIKAVESALKIINDNKWFHHKILISNGLMNFNGDKEKLAEILWSKLKEWNENLMSSIIQFITNISEKFKEPFLKTLKSKNITLEIRLEIIRYFRTHIFDPVKPLLLKYLKNQKSIDENISIVSAVVLEKYPGEETISVLKSVLNNSTWNIKNNIANSLNFLKTERKDYFSKENDFDLRSTGGYIA